MQHLTQEAIARLVDEEATDQEEAHLATCAPCAAELTAMRDQLASLRALPAERAKGAGWEALEVGLRGEGLIRGGAPARSPAFWRIAATIAVFLVGSMAGAAAVSLRGDPVTTAAVESPSVDTPAPASAAEAAANVRMAEDAYLAAIESYAEITSVPSEVDPIERLTALEGILLTTGAALRDAPADPVINNYHLTALGMRDALLRQIEDVEGEQWY